MKIEEAVLLDFDNVLIKPKRSELTSRKDVNITRSFVFKHSNKIWSGVPIFSSNMDTTGTIEIFDVFKKFNMPVAFHKHYDVEQIAKVFINNKYYDNYMWYCMGITEHDKEKFNLFKKILNDKGVNNFNICVDVANGYTQMFADFIERLRNECPECPIMAGNVCTPEMTEELILKGADIIKCGIGPSTACHTRIVAGVGVPQLSAIIECADAAHGLQGHLCGDGGIKTPADMSKAFAANADFVMCGSVFAAHDESGGELIIENGQQYKLFYGMSSETAMKKYSGGVASHRSSEGATIKLPHRGPIEETILYFQGGLRSTMTYVGAKKLKDLSKCTTFVRVNSTNNKVYDSYKIGK
jgi:GMP reductase